MKKLLILLIALSGCSNADNEGLHVHFITSNTNIAIYTVCINRIEYITSYKAGTILSVNKDGKPIQCTY